MSWSYKVILAIFLIGGALSFSFLQENKPSEQKTSEQEADVKINAEAYTKAFNARDIDKLKLLWAQDAIYINLSTNETLKGRNEIADYFTEQFKNQEATVLKIVIDDIKFNDQGKAIEKGTAITTAKDGVERKSAFVAELAKSDKTWVLDKVYEVDKEPPANHYEELKELEWLLGKWNSKNEYVELTLNTQWGGNKNFLIQKFTIELLGQKSSEGKQIIAWDPNKKKIRSWIIDSDGGFGEGFWTKQGDKWYVGMAFTLPDGRKASTTQIYTKKDNDSFTFASEDRDVDGKMLPNIKPIQINKMP